MLRGILFLWRATRGSRLRPWRSPYLRWRMETYIGKSAESITFTDFWRLAVTEWRQMLRFCGGQAKYKSMRGIRRGTVRGGSMGSWTRLVAADGHELSAYGAAPEGVAVGSVVILQEIFGVNGHIRSVVDGYAAEGYVAIAPALFDRLERDVELTYEGADMQKAFSLMQGLNADTALKDIAAAFEELKKAGKGIGVVGFCYGGLLSWLTATRGENEKMQPDCCVGYYAGGIGKFAGEEPSCPVMLHFGAEDTHIGQDQVEAVRAAHPEVEVHVYPGVGHAFNNDVRASYNEEAAKTARTRTLEFLRKHIA